MTSRQWILLDLLALAVLGYVVSVSQLESATRQLAQYNVLVPDLLPFRSAGTYREIFEGMPSSACELYLRTIWTWDVLFPISYGLGLYVLIRQDLGSWELVPLAAALADVCENLLATAILNGSQVVSTAYALVSAAKWILLFVAVLGVLASFVRLVVVGIRRLRSRTPPP